MNRMSELEAPDLDTVINLLRALTQGEGLTADAVRREKAPGIYDEFDASDLVELIQWSADQLIDTPQTDAIRNALGLGAFKGATLTERREQYLKLAGVSLRTLIRHEQAGAEVLADQMVLGKAGSKQESKIARLEQQIEDLQILVARLSDPSNQNKSLILASESAGRRVLERAEKTAEMRHLMSMTAPDVSRNGD